MDPQATWEQLSVAYAHGEWQEAAESASSLLAWLDKNGFPPRTSEPNMGEAWNRAVARAVCHLVARIGHGHEKSKPV